ncbi:MAG: response regulator transcription factor [Caldilineales bacterium]
MLEESLRLNREIGHSWGIATVLGSLGWVALAQHDLKRMKATLGESLSIRMEIGDRGGIAWCLEKLAEAALIQAETAPASARIERYQTATRALATAAAIRAPIESVIDPADHPAHLRVLAALRAALGDTAFADAWAEGAVMSIETAVARALAEPAPAADSQPARPNPAAEGFGGLTAREREVAVLIAQGKSNREIAEAMTVRVKTVETYVTRILSKLNFDSRVQVATWALETGLASSSHQSDS